MCATHTTRHGLKVHISSRSSDIAKGVSGAGHWPSRKMKWWNNGVLNVLENDSRKEAATKDFTRKCLSCLSLISSCRSHRYLISNKAHFEIHSLAHSTTGSFDFTDPPSQSWNTELPRYRDTETSCSLSLHECPTNPDSSCSLSD